MRAWMIGVMVVGVAGCITPYQEPSAPLKLADATPYRTAYRLLWESINGKGSWERNDFVWVLSFKQLSHGCAG